MVHLFLGFSGDGKSTALFSFCSQDNSIENDKKLMISDDIYTIGSKKRLQVISDIIGIRHIILEKMDIAAYIEEEITKGNHIYIDSCSRNQFSLYAPIIERIKKENLLNLVFVIDVSRFLYLLNHKKLDLSQYNSLIITKCDFLMGSKAMIKELSLAFFGIPEEINLYISIGSSMPDSLIKLEDRNSLHRILTFPSVAPMTYDQHHGIR